MVLSEFNTINKNNAKAIAMIENSYKQNDERLQIVRPTEAQLRWSQFHHKKRAKAVQQNLQQLWQSPLLVSEVHGATSDDGVTTDESTSYSFSRREKPKISRGRRALLRVSQRAYRQRQAVISESGFQCTAVDKENQREESDVVNDIFNMDAISNRTKSRRRRTSHLSRGLQTSEDDERMQRFEAAYSMMMSMRPLEHPKIMVPGRRWTRPDHMEASVSIDGRSYEAWKWGLTKQRQRQQKGRTKGLTNMPFDRRASWLIHLPARKSSVRRYSITQTLDSEGNPLQPVHLHENQQLFLSPGQLKFDELVMSLQHKDGSMIFPNNPHRGAGLEQYEQHLEEHYCRQQGSPHFTRPNKLRFEEHNQEYQSKIYSTLEKHSVLNGKRRESDVHSPDTLGDSDFFHQVINTHVILDTKNETITSPQSVNVVTRDSDFVQRQTFSDCRRESNVFSIGTSSLGESDFFAQARRMHDTVLGKHVKLNAHKPQDSGAALLQYTHAHGNQMSIDRPTLQVVPESEMTDESPGKACIEILAKNMEKKSASEKSLLSFGARMGGLLNLVTGKQTSEGGESSLSAYAAFRQRRESNDDTSSASSFRLLPDSIRRAVQGFTVKGTGPRSDECDVSFDENEDSRPELDIMHPESDSTGQYSPSHSLASRSVIDSISPEHGKIIHQRYLQSSAFMADTEMDETIIDTDDTTSDASGAKMDAKTAASLLLSPTILTKRHRQAIKAVENRNWEQVMYLISANPWLAEMMEVTTEQYLLHKVALYGAGEVEVDNETGEIVKTKAPAAPEKLNIELIRRMPSCVHKFDKDGNLPLHMAAASGNVAMAKILGEKFPSGASVRNEDGMLPLHLAIQACYAPLVNGEGDLIYGSAFVSSVLKLFPRAIVVSDNEGNLPIHVVATSLQGDLGVDVIFMLSDEANKQADSGTGVRFNELNNAKSVDDDIGSVATDATATPTDSLNMEKDFMYSNLVRNENGQTPLTTAICSLAGWEVIEALARGPGGSQAALLPDRNMCNSLHLLVGDEFGDPIAALSILRIAPRAASVRNEEGILPIEIASMQMMPREVVMALALVDLPIDLAENEGVKVREESGGSWWFLACECDDYHVDLVEEIISICSYQQLRELCFMKGGPNRSCGPVISRATPQNRQVLRKALRFVGRFEFLGNSAAYTDEALGLKVFEALDFGTDSEGDGESRRVILQCYTSEDSYRQESSLLLEHNLDFHFVEEISDFSVFEISTQISESSPQQYCLAIEKPNLTLDRVVDGMQKKEEYRFNEEMRNRYISKICMVLRLIAKAVQYLHVEGIVHGDICLETCGKIRDKWKLTNIIGSQNIGQRFLKRRLSESLPPEAVYIRLGVPYFIDVEAKPSVDIWAFGKLAFEALTGKALLDFDPDVEVENDSETMMKLFNWGKASMRDTIDSLRHASVPNVGIDMISECLLPNPDDRPSSMDNILKHPFWKGMRRKTARSTPRSTDSSKESYLHEI
jgi:hypothetical protein